ncbi:MAG TPA: helix-turn-helix transcriptional regulator [Candidatus Binatia bacterium]|nr:helix-turn-helix transcriptional regulator [Candidatus Binatia bacterium]
MPNKKKNASAGSRSYLAMNLQYARTLRGWSQEQLGFECSLKRTYIGALERGEVNPGLDNIDRIARALGVPGHTMIQDPREAHPHFLSSAKRR